MSIEAETENGVGNAFNLLSVFHRSGTGTFCKRVFSMLARDFRKFVFWK